MVSSYGHKYKVKLLKIIFIVLAVLFSMVLLFGRDISQSQQQYLNNHEPASHFLNSWVYQQQYLNNYELLSLNKLPGYVLPSGLNLEYWGTNLNTYFYKTRDGDGSYKAPFWTKGDFNKDSIVDWVYILFKKNTDKAIVFAFISKTSGEYIIREVSVANKYMGVSTEEFLEDSLPIDALKVFEFEGHGQVYSWDNKKKDFTVCNQRCQK